MIHVKSDLSLKKKSETFFAHKTSNIKKNRAFIAKNDSIRLKNDKIANNFQMLTPNE